MTRRAYHYIFLIACLFLSLTIFALPQVTVRGNGFTIPDATGTWPDTTGQAFGVLQASNDSVSNAFWIFNTGTSDLTLSNFRVTAAYAAHFNIFPPTNLVVPAGDSVAFEVQYKPTAAGTHGRTTGGSGLANVVFDSDDPANGTYLFSVSGAALADPAFDCSNGRMIFSRVGGGTDIEEWNYTEQPPTRSTINNSYAWNHDGMGMNPNDNYIYAMRYNGGARHQLWAFSSTGVATFCGYVSGGGITSGMGLHLGGGAMDNNNNLFVFQNGDATSSLKKINVRSQQAEEITLSSPVHARSAIYNPTDGLLYAMSAGATNDGLVSVDPTNGNVTLIGGNGDLTYAAMFRSSDGTVYMMSQTYTMYAVDLSTGAITQVADNPGWGDGTWVDGCACGDISLEADLAITKTDNRPSYVPGSLSRYTITVTNAGPHGAYQATVQDAVPAGITPANVSWYSTTYGTATSRFTAGTGALNDTIDIGVGDSIVYTVRIIVDNGFTGNLTNTATVSVPAFLTDPNAANNTATDVDVPVGSAAEQCNNGFDDDGDGLVDCFDGDCAGNVVCASHFTNGVIPACPDTPNVAAFSMQLQWSSTAGEDYVTPVVGDMDSDGLPEIVTVNYGNGRVYVLNGQDGSTITNIAYQGVYHNFSGGAAIADIDNDGTAEIFLVTGNAQSGAAGLNCRQWISCFDYDNGALTQRYRVSYGQINLNEYSDQKWAVVQFADFDEDGTPELFIGNHVMNSATGAIIASPTTAQRNSWPRGRIAGSTFSDYMSAAADVLPASACASCDGLELICGNTVYAVDLSDPTNDQNGITLATEMAPTGTYTDGLTSLADWDGDGHLDVIVSTAAGGSSNFYIWNPREDTVIINTTVLPNSTGGGSGRASIADFDGDGVNELAIVTTNRLHLYENDGSLKWTLNSTDASSKTSATAFDFEGDGNMEVVYRDEQNLRILDGATGAVKDVLGCTSGTRVEMPIVVDVDSDGEAEICISCGSNTRVYTSDQTPWMPTRKVWNSVHYVPTFINDDLSVPAHRQPKATTPRMDIYAAQVPITDPSGNLIYPALPDFTVSIDSSSVGNCNDDSTAIHVTICNDDAPSLVYDYPLSFYDGDPNSGGTLLGTRWVTLANTTFTRDSCYYFSFNAANQPTDLYVMVNDSGTGTFGFPTTHLEECDSTNNQANADIGCAIDAGITKDDGQLSYIPGGPVTYTIIAKNNGPNFTGGVVSDPLPAGISAGDVTWTATTHGGATTTAVGTMNGALQDTVDIPGGDSITYLVTIATPASLVGDLVNTVTITVTGDTILTNNTATDTDTVDCTFAISGTVNSRTAGWTEIGTVRSGNTYNFGTGGGFKSFTATNGPESGQVVNTVVYNNGTGNQVSLTRNRYNSGNSWFNTISTYDNTPHGWTGLSGTAPENAPILGFMAFIDQNGNGTFDSGSEEYIRDLTTLSITPTTTGQLYMAFYDDGFYNDNNGILTLNASVSAATVDVGNDTTLCAGNTLTLDAGNPGATYSWNTGANTQTIVANSTGEYSVAVNTGGGCVVRDTIDVSVDTITVSLRNDTSICSGDSIQLDAGNPGLTYLWSSGQTSQTIYVKTAGQHSVAVTNGNGCVGRDTMTISAINPLPSVDFGPDTSSCGLDSIILDAHNTGAIFLWSDASAAQTLTVKTNGQYFVEVNALGCIGRDTINVVLDTIPAVSFGNDTSFCQGDSVTLDAGAGYGYLWNDASTNQTLVATSAGQYFVAITDGNGCVGRDTMDVTAVNANPTVSLQNDSSICAGDSIVLDAGAGFTYAWNDASTAQTLSVNAAGQYHVTITDGNGCQSSDSMTLISVDTLPLVDLGPSPTTICAGSSLLLDAGNSGATYEWHDGSTNQTFSANGTGTYYVSVTTDSGCVARDTLVISATSISLDVNLGNDTSICTGNSMILNARNNGATYLWNDGSTNRTLNVNSAGQYYVRVEDPSGCVGSDTIDIALNPLPVVTLIFDLTSCTNAQSITLTEGTPIANPPSTTGIYSGPGISTSPLFNPAAAGEGSHEITYTYTDANGCSNSASDTIFVFDEPNVDLGPDVNFCEFDSITVDAGAGFISYFWNTGDNSQMLSVSTAGSYDVLITDSNGCSSRDTIDIATDPAPIVNLGNDQSICSGTSLVIDAGNSGSTFLWNDGSTKQNLTVSAAGTYNVAVTNGIGCTGRDTFELLSLHNNPIVDLGNDMTICAGSIFTLDAGNSGLSFLWDNGTTGKTRFVNSLGQYSVTVTDGNGCVGRDTIAITGFAANLTVNLGPDASICQGESYSINAGNPGAIYIWNTGASGQTISVNALGQYHVLVEDQSGCTGRDTMEITSLHAAPTINLGNDTSICSGTSITLDAGNSGLPTLWNTGSNTQTINVNTVGTYSVTIQNSSGCIGSDSMEIIAVNSLPIVDLGPDFYVCEGETVELSVGSYPSVVWSTGSTFNSLSIDTSMTVWVRVTDDDGCSGTDTVFASWIASNDTLDLGIDTAVCFASGDELLLEIDQNLASIKWQDGSSNESFLVLQEGLYHVVARDSNNCMMSDSLNVTDSCGTFTITIPNVFNPTDYPLIPLEEPDPIIDNLRRINFQVYNRWGLLLHATSGSLPHWDGTMMGSSKPCASGVYFWILNYEDYNGNKYAKNGFTHLIRPN